MEDSTSEGDQVSEETNEPEVEVTDQSEMSPADESATATDESADDGDTFPRSYVEELRQENGKYRQRAQRADELAHRLHRALVEQTGRLQDASDLDYDESHLEDAGALTAAIDELLTAKPHLSKRMISGEIGQGATPSGSSVDLAALLRGRR